MAGSRSLGGRLDSTTTAVQAQVAVVAARAAVVSDKAPIRVQNPGHADAVHADAQPLVLFRRGVEGRQDLVTVCEKPRSVQR